MPDIDPTAIYPEERVDLRKAENPITVAEMKEWLGWESEIDSNKKFGDDYLAVDRTGTKFRCSRNTNNRPFDRKWCEQIMQDILNSGDLLPPEKRRWQFNMENMIIGKYGQAISIQHRGIALIWAAQEWADGVHAGHWRKIWSDEPTITGTVAFGAPETAECIRTIDNTKTQTISDVLFRSDLFRDTKPKERAQICKILEYATRFIWDRTGMKVDAYSPYLSNSEATEFLERHPNLVKAVSFIHGNDSKSVSYYLPLGTAAGLTYLMGSCTSDPKDYFSAEVPGDNNLDFSMMEKAEEFWVLLIGRAKETEAVRLIRRPVTEESEYSGLIFDPNAKGSLMERTSAIIHGWNQFKEKGKCTEAGIRLPYEVEDDVAYLIEDEVKLIGGIDDPRKEPVKIEKKTKPKSSKKPTKKEVEDEIEKVKEEKKTKKKNGDTKPLTYAEKKKRKAEQQVSKQNEDALKELEGYRSKYPGSVILIQGPQTVSAYGEDAEALEFTSGLQLKKKYDVDMVSFPKGDTDQYLGELLKEGYPSVVLGRQKGKSAVIKQTTLK